MERRIIESNIGDIESTIKGIMDKKLFNKFGRKPTSNQAFILRHSISIICASFKLVLDLNARAATKYDSTNKAHEKKLLDVN